MKEATPFMGVDDADGLQVGIDDGGAHKLHASFFRSLEIRSERGDGVLSHS